MVFRHMFSAETERKCWDIELLAQPRPKTTETANKKIFNCSLFSSHCSPAGLSNDMSCTCNRPFPEQPPSCNPLHNVHSLLTYSFDSSSVSDAPAMLWVVPRQFAITFTVNGDSHAWLQRFQRISPAGDEMGSRVQASLKIS